GAAGSAGPGDVPGPPRGQGRGTLRRLDRAICTMRPTPPSSTILEADSAKPVTISLLIFGGMDSALGSVTTSTRAGPLWRNADFSAPASSFGFSTRTPWAPQARATAAKSGFFMAVASE